MLSFEMTGEVAEEFFRRVQLLEIDNEETRTGVLIKMAKEGLITRVMETKRSKEEYVQDLQKNFNVLDVTSKKDV